MLQRLLDLSVLFCLPSFSLCLLLLGSLARCLHHAGHVVVLIARGVFMFGAAILLLATSLDEEETSAALVLAHTDVIGWPANGVEFSEGLFIKLVLCGSRKPAAIAFRHVCREVPDHHR